MPEELRIDTDESGEKTKRLKKEFFPRLDSEKDLKDQFYPGLKSRE